MSKNKKSTWDKVWDKTYNIDNITRLIEIKSMNQELYHDVLCIGRDMAVYLDDNKAFDETVNYVSRAIYDMICKKVDER